MVNIYKSNGMNLVELEEPEEGCWIRVTEGTPEELVSIAHRFHIDVDDMKAPMDEEEKSRLEVEDNYTMVLVDIPVKEFKHDNKKVYVTAPLGIFLVDDVIITVCSEDTSIVRKFVESRVRYFSTQKRVRFLYLLLLHTMIHYQEVLRAVDDKRVDIEARISEHKEKEDDLIELHNMDSTLVYFETSLRANNVVIERIKRMKSIPKYEDDEDIFDDVVVENRQAIEMTTIYRSLIDGTSDLMTNVIDNRLNNMMKILTSITLVMAVPTIISGLYGMNVNAAGMPFAITPMGFGIICLLTTIICIVLLIILKKKNML